MAGRFMTVMCGAIVAAAGWPLVGTAEAYDGPCWRGWVAPYWSGGPGVSIAIGPSIAIHAYRGGVSVSVAPRAPAAVYGRASYGYRYPSHPLVQQPIGHEKVWTSPNGYVYRPLYAAPHNSAPPSPGARAEMPAASEPSGRDTPAALAPGVQSVAEVIPTPAPQSGPREF